MAQDVYRQAADRPKYEAPPPVVFVDPEQPKPAPVLLRDDELAPVIFDEDLTAARAADLYEPVAFDNRLVLTALSVGGIAAIFAIAVTVLLTG